MVCNHGVASSSLARSTKFPGKARFFQGSSTLQAFRFTVGLLTQRDAGAARDFLPPCNFNRRGCKKFRATGVTAPLENGGTIENAQAIAAHESPRTTKLYDRTSDEITLAEVERVLI